VTPADDERDAPPAGETGEADPWARSDNPADPGLSALPGHEKKSYMVPVSIGIGIALLAIVAFIAMPKGPRPPTLVLENLELGFRAEYPSELISGPNYVKTSAGSILTVDRKSLVDPLPAKREWVAQLPDSMYEVALAEIQMNYAYVKEISQTHLTIDGRKALEVVMEGLPAGREPLSTITVDMVATDQWVYTLRAYSPKSRDAQERPLFAYFRDHFKMLPSSGPQKAS